MPSARSAIFVGAPRTGKTHAAIAWTLEWARLEPKPILCIDSTRASNFAAWPRAASLPQLGAMLWRARTSRVAWLPADRAEVDACIRGVRELGNVHVLVDESAFWLDSARGRGGELERLLRSARHSGVTIALTTQYAGADIPQTVWGCSPEVYVFRTKSPRALAALGRLFGAPAVAPVASLPDRKYLRFDT